MIIIKKVILLILLLFTGIFTVDAADFDKGSKYLVDFVKCVDGDTATFSYNNEEIKVRFLAVDTPETKHPQKGTEPFGPEASEYTCSRLTEANKIELEFDLNSTITDKYSRHLSWIFVDDYLLQDLLIKEGLAEVAYLYGDYKYTSLLQDHEAVAKANKTGKWGDYVATASSVTSTNDNPEEEPNYVLIAVVIAIILIGCVISTTLRSKVSKKVSRNVKKELKKKMRL